jgi:hypothetical protein
MILTNNIKTFLVSLSMLMMMLFQAHLNKDVINIDYYIMCHVSKPLSIIIE